LPNPQAFISSDTLAKTLWSSSRHSPNELLARGRLSTSTLELAISEVRTRTRFGPVSGRLRLPDSLLGDSPEALVDPRFAEDDISLLLVKRATPAPTGLLL
jgi:hypothetical protein